VRPLRARWDECWPLPRWPARFFVLVGHVRQAREVSERDRVDWRARSDWQGRVAAPSHEEARAQGDAPLALAPSRAKPGVSLERLDVRMSAGDRAFQVGKRHVFAAAGKCLGQVAPNALSVRAPRPRSVPLVFAARLTRLEDRHPRERRERGFDALPNPASQKLARGVLEPRYLIEVVMVEELVGRLPRVVKLLEIEKPARALVDRPADDELHAKTVAMKARALVARRHPREAVRSFEAKIVC
jgi:hypothetical protein